MCVCVCMEEREKQEQGHGLKISLASRVEWHSGRSCLTRHGTDLLRPVYFLSWLVKLKVAGPSVFHPAGLRVITRCLTGR